MGEFGVIGNICNEDFMIHVLDYVPKEYNLILDHLENCLMSSGLDELTIKVICEKFKHWYEQIKNKNEEIKTKEKSISSLWKLF